MSVKLLIEHNLEFLSLKGDNRGLSESTLVKMPHCWKSHVMAHLSLLISWSRGQYHHIYTVKPVLSCYSKEDQKLIFNTDYPLMQGKSIAECSKGKHSAIHL